MSAPSEFFDELETRSPAAREEALMAALPRQVAHAKRHAPAFARILADVNPAEIACRAALARLPVTRKSDLVELQGAEPPLGGLAAIAAGAAARLFASPGPIYEVEAARTDYWRMARALYAAGFRQGDIVHNSFSYHLSPGGWILDSGARALGCAVFPGGVGNRELQARAIAQLRPVGFTGTPDFLKALLGVGLELKLDCSSIKNALVSGAALPAHLRREFEDRGIRVQQAYATADVGLIAYESAALEGMILGEDIIVEVVRPGTGEPVADGELGEVVVTTLDPDYPLIRFATGDLSAVLPGLSPCGRTNTRIKGWLGRADQATKIKGMFVHPSQVAGVIERHPEILKARLVVDREADSDVMTLHCEVDGGCEQLAAAIGESVQALCKVRGRVLLAVPGTLPDDGKIIDDTRRLC